MKKRNFFLIIILAIIISNFYPKIVLAEGVNFHEAEYIDGIYINRYNPDTKTIHYQKARFFRKNISNEFAYCLEPFTFFKDDSSYSETSNIENISKEKMKKIALIAHFGYGYKNHTDLKWYPITQLLIWKEAFPNGDYYFTNRAAGERINIFEEEIQEIYNLISQYQETPKGLNQEYKLIEGEKLSLNISNENNMLKTNDPLVTITSNNITTKELKKGTYNIKITKDDSFYNKPYLIYHSQDSQALLTTGDIEKIEYELRIKVYQTELQITKIDKDTQSIVPSGQANLNHAKFTIKDKNNNIIAEKEINNNTITLKNISFGKYYIQETEAGEGYNKNNKIYEIEITENNPINELIIDNEVIKKKIIIEKKYGENSDFKVEKYISFQILNEKKEVVNTITTNEEGIAEITLPYGEYTFIQLNTKEGYKLIEPFKVEVKNNEEEKIELKDYKIPVPDTHINQNIWQIVIKILLQLI